MTQVYLIRHAEADGNLYRRAHGHYDGGVTLNGYKQIECLRKRFSEIPVDAVYSSDLFRTKTTAKAVYEDKKLPLNADPALREIKLGCWEDLPWGELLVSYPVEYDLWAHQPDKFNIEGGETHAEVFLRLKAELDRLVKKHQGETIVLVSHGAAIRALLCGLIYSGDMTHLNDIGWCDNTAVSFIYADEKLQYDVKYYNDNSHLKEFSTLEKQVWWRKSDDPALFNLRFSPAELQRDKEKLLEYYRATWQYVFHDNLCDDNYANKQIQKMLAADPRAIVYAMRGSEELGVIMLDTRARVCPSSGHIALLFLKEQFRGYGFGAQLIGHAVSVYSSIGRNYITVRVSKDNLHAVSFYKKCGFEEVAREQSGLFTQLIMKKSIVF